MLIKDQEARLNLEDIKLSKWMKINEKMASFQETYQHKIMTRDKTETTKESSKVVTRFFSKPKTTHEESNAEINYLYDVPTKGPRTKLNYLAFTPLGTDFFPLLLLPLESFPSAVR